MVSLLFECNAIARQIGHGQSFKLDSLAYILLPVHPNYRDEASSKDELFKNYMAALNIEAVQKQDDGSWILTRK